MNKVYSGAKISWDVRIADQIQMPWFRDEYNNTIEFGTNAWLSNYTKLMNKIIKNGERLISNSDNSSYYLFIVKNVKTSDGTLPKAFMPKAKRWGFVFDTNIKSPKGFLRAIAHELGHGAFHMTHVFQDFSGIQRGSTKNLMDYGGGDILRKYQWNDIHHKRKVAKWGQAQEDNAAFGQKGTKTFCIGDDKLIMDLNEEYNKFYLPDGRIIDTKNRLTVSGFFDKTDVTKKARGAVSHIRVNQFDYKHHYSLKEKSTVGYGFKLQNPEKLVSVKIDSFLCADASGAVRVFKDFSNANDLKLLVKGVGVDKVYKISEKNKCTTRTANYCDYIWQKTKADKNAIGHEFTNPNNVFYAVVKNDPCLLLDLANNPFYGVEILPASEHEGLIFMVVFGTATALLVAPIIAPYVVQFGSRYVVSTAGRWITQKVRKELVKQIKEMGVDALVQFSFNFLINTLTDEEKILEADYSKILVKSFDEINWTEVVTAPLANKLGDESIFYAGAWGCMSSLSDKIIIKDYVPTLTETSAKEILVDCVKGIITESISFLVSAGSEKRSDMAKKMKTKLSFIRSKILKNPNKLFSLCSAIRILDNASMRKFLKALGFEEFEIVKILKRFCFPAGTPIYANGLFFKNIEDIEIGDYVDARDENGSLSLHKVIKLFENQGSDLVSVYSKGDLVFSSTPSHQVYTNGIWKTVKSLTKSDCLFGLQNEDIPVDSIVYRAYDDKVYNFEVEDVHNYFAGNLPVLVHNKNCGVFRQMLQAEYSSLYAKISDHLDKFETVFSNFDKAELKPFLEKINKFDTKTLKGFVETLSVRRIKLVKKLLIDDAILEAWKILINRRNLRYNLEYLENLKSAFKFIPDGKEAIISAINTPNLEKGLGNLLEALGNPELIFDKTSLDKFLKELKSLKVYADFDADFGLKIGEKLDDMVKITRDALSFESFNKLKAERNDLRAELKKLKKNTSE
ncbi:MAG: Hint domain-containing protein, partial [Marinifilaceae bacterium]|nr:Hint domain-containing protein [Marinifilaceae bacterium]